MADAVLDETEESGWKNIHGEVFRFPPNKNLFCAFVGSGFQVSLSCLPSGICQIKDCCLRNCTGHRPEMSSSVMPGSERWAEAAAYGRLARRLILSHPKFTLALFPARHVAAGAVHLHLWPGLRGRHLPPTTAATSLAHSSCCIR